MKMRSEKRAVDKIYKRRNRYEIPDWQRDKVWDKQKKQQLIDSILRGWRLPKFYLYKIGEDQYEVVDGQQRLNAIFEFFDNKLPLSKQSAEIFGGEYYKDLPPKVSDIFDDFEIDYDEIEDATEQDLKEFFQRLQEGLPLTSSERLNSVHSKLRDFCRDLAKHPFFSEKVSVSNTRYAHFDIVAKVAAIEVDGISTVLRYDDLKEVFESNNNFSKASSAAKNLKATFDFLSRVFPERSLLLRNRTIVQAFATLAGRLIKTEKVNGREKDVREFFERFMKELNQQVELGQDATDKDYIEFQRSINANLKEGAKTRQEVLLRKLLALAPNLAEMFDPTIIHESGLRIRIIELGEVIASLVSQANSAFSSKNGEDLFKATNKTVQTQMRIGKMVNDFNGYQLLIDDLYFLFHESIGTRLDNRKPPSFLDVNSLRTELQHDVDHGDRSKVISKRRKLGAAFAKYSGVTSPYTYPQENFASVQASLLTALEADLRALIPIL